MSKPIFILGGEQSDFSKNWARQDQSIFDMFSQTVSKGLENAKLNPSDVEVGHVGNFVAERFVDQGLLGGMFGHVHEGFKGMPTSRHEGACASGSLALMAAMADLESGRYDIACVLGIEMMRNVSGQEAADNLGTAAWAGIETRGRKYVWPSMFSDIAEEYDRRYGLQYTHLAALSKKNFDNAKSNPLAQTRNWDFSENSFTEDNEANPVIEGWMRRQDCAQVTDGAACIFIANEKGAEKIAKRNSVDLSSYARIKGWGHTTSQMMLADKLGDSKKSGGHMFPWMRKAIFDAYARAGIAGADQLDGIETHDCFSITEYAAIEHFGIAQPGEAWKAIEAEATLKNGDIPMNVSGGLIGVGHPVGATGIRMVWDCARQVTGQAGSIQIEGAKNMATFNVGGAATANCSFVIGV